MAKFDKKNYLDIEKIIRDGERVLYKENINEEYSHDELGNAHSAPDIVVKALTTEEVSSIARYAYENEIPLTVRGSGTGLVGACVPVCGGIVLDVSIWASTRMSTTATASCRTHRNSSARLC